MLGVPPLAWPRREEQQRSLVERLPCGVVPLPQVQRAPPIVSVRLASLVLLVFGGVWTLFTLGLAVLLWMSRGVDQAILQHLQIF